MDGVIIIATLDFHELFSAFGAPCSPRQIRRISSRGVDSSKWQSQDHESLDEEFLHVFGKRC